MKMIAPVFHPRARISPAIEAAAADVMLARARAEGHTPEHLLRPLRTRPLTEMERATCSVIAARLREGVSARLIGRDLGISKENVLRLITRAGIGRDGSEVRR